MASVMRDTSDMPIWVERYRPKTINDCILPEALKRAFKNVVKTGTIPNMLFAGKAGIGKTTVAGAICNETGADMLFINASMEGNIDTLRTTIRQFASTQSMDGRRKVVLLDEADNLNPTSTQPALRGFIEEFAGSTSFIMTCNYANKIIPPLHSRCSTYLFNVPKGEKPAMMAAVDKRVRMILAKEHVEATDDIIAEVVGRHFPDIRRILNCLQGSISNSQIDGQKALSTADDELKKLVKLIKSKEYLKMRHWISEHQDIEPAAITRYLYDCIDKIVECEAMIDAVAILAEGERTMPFVINQDINLAHILGSLMPIAKEG